MERLNPDASQTLPCQVPVVPKTARRACRQESCKFINYLTSGFYMPGDLELVLATLVPLPFAVPTINGPLIRI